MTFQWTLPNLIPPRKHLQPYEWDVLLDLAGGMTFAEIADDTGLTHAEIREAIEVLIEVRFLRPCRGWYRNRVTARGRQAIREERTRRDRRREITWQTCPRCGQSGWGGCPDAVDGYIACIITAIYEQAREHVRTRLPPAGTPLDQLTLFETER